MRLTTRTMKAMATMGLTAALAAGALAGCGAPKTETQDADQAKVEEKAEDTTNVQETTAQDDTATDATDVQTEAASSNTVNAGSFTFEIPDYWAGKVETTLSEGTDGPVAIVHLTGNENAKLATVSLCAGEEPAAAGDIGGHLVGSVPDGKGNHVEVWTLNWPWIAANTTAPEGVSESELRTLVDLSTGGALTYDDAMSAGQNVGMEESDYTGSILPPTIQFA